MLFSFICDVREWLMSPEYDFGLVCMLTTSKGEAMCLFYCIVQPRC